MIDGGPAFPRPTFVNVDPMHDKAGQISCDDGMSLRDWFAGKALPTCISRTIGCGNENAEVFEAARLAFRYADEALKARGVAPDMKDCIERNATCLEKYAVECFPEIVNGQKHFVRMLMESVAEELRASIAPKTTGNPA